VFPIVLTWLAFWYLPWQAGLNSHIWLRLGIALILFTIPGICVYGLIVDRSAFTFSHITFGFVISHLIFAMLGTMGRFFHFSFETIKLLMAVTGTVLLFLYLLPILRNGIKFQIKPIRKSDLLPAVLMLVVSLAACLIVIQRVLTDDDLTYLAYITNWQNSLHLDFNDVIFGTSELVHPRFWLMSAPFAQALLADISNVPGILLISGYYEPFLVVLSVLCWYELARALKFSPRAAGASSMLQLAFLLLLSEYLHPGSPFFTQLSADKATAAFILAPVFFQSLVRSLERPAKFSYVMPGLTGLSLTLMHPVILAYSVFIGGIFVLLNWRRVGISQKIILIATLLAILLPQVSLRFASVSSQAEIPFSSQELPVQGGLENMVKRWGDTQFYGFNPSILDMKLPFAEKIPLPQPIAARGWLVFPFLAAAFALRKFRKQVSAQFILACSLLGVLAWFPISGWIIGYFLSAWMLERALWLFPFGLSAVYALSGIREIIKAHLSGKERTGASSSPSNWSLLTIALLTLGLFLLHMRENNLPDLEKFSAKSQRYRGLAVAGQELNRLISDQAYVLGSEQLNDLIPGISSKAKPIIFRISQPSNMPYLSGTQVEARIFDTKRLFSKGVPSEEQMSLLEKYDIRFLLLPSFDLRLFEGLIAAYPDRVNKIETGGVIILQVNSP
jgi:hypothetical protein